jgi:hypothetical protein
MTDRRRDETSQYLVTCKACRLAMYRQGPVLPEHGPVDNRCKGSGLTISDDTVEGWAKVQAEMAKRRKKLEALVWKHKHADFKGKVGGKKTVLKLIAGSGTCLVELSSLTDGELVDMLPRKVREAEGFHGFKVLVDEGNRKSWLMKNSKEQWALAAECLKADAEVFSEEYEVERALRRAVSPSNLPWERVYI